MVSFENSLENLLLLTGMSFNRLQSIFKETVLLAVILSLHLSIGSALYSSLIKSSDTCVVCNGSWQINAHSGAWFWLQQASEFPMFSGKDMGCSLKKDTYITYILASYINYSQRKAFVLLVTSSRKSLWMLCC